MRNAPELAPPWRVSLTAEVGIGELWGNWGRDKFQLLQTAAPAGLQELKLIPTPIHDGDVCDSPGEDAFK